MHIKNYSRLKVKYFKVLFSCMALSKRSAQGTEMRFCYHSLIGRLVQTERVSVAWNNTLADMVPLGAVFQEVNWLTGG